jgi:hypothetical protein
MRVLWSLWFWIPAFAGMTKFFIPSPVMPAKAGIHDADA